VLGACRLTGPPELLEARKETGNISLAAAAAAAAAAETRGPKTPEPAAARIGYLSSWRRSRISV